MNYNELSKRAHEVAVLHGFWNENTEINDRIMGIVMEVGRAADAYRRNMRAFQKIFTDNLHHTGLGISFRMNYEMNIQNTVESAFANIVIRLLDLAGAMQIDFDVQKEFDLMNYETLKGLDFSAMSFLQTAYIFVSQYLYLTAHECGDGRIYLICLRFMEQWAEHLNIDLEWFVKTRMDLNEGMNYKNCKLF